MDLTVTHRSQCVPASGWVLRAGREPDQKGPGGHEASTSGAETDRKRPQVFERWEVNKQIMTEEAALMEVFIANRRN